MPKKSRAASRRTLVLREPLANLRHLQLRLLQRAHAQAMTPVPNTSFIIFIHGGNAIDDETARTIRGEVAAFGLGLEPISVTDPEAALKLSTLLRDRRPDVFCFLSSNFWALNIRNGDQLLHKLTDIPLVCYLQDHPVYFLHLVSPSLDGVVMFALGDDCGDFIAKHYGVRATTIAQPSGPLPHYMENEPDRADFLGRKNQLLCPMNLTIFGLTIDDVWDAIKALPAPRGSRVKKMIDIMLTDCVTPLHVASERLANAGEPEIAVEDLQWVLNFVKLWRRLQLVDMLIELPILVSSEYVPADHERKYPQKFTLLTVPETIRLYRQYRFVVNANPLITGAFHDRVTQAITNNAVCITDPNAVLHRHFHDEQEMLFVDYSRSDLADKITLYLEDPNLAYTMTVRCFDVWKQYAGLETAYRRLLGVVTDMRSRTL